MGTSINKFRLLSDIQTKGRVPKGKKLEIYRQLFRGKPEKCNGGITAKYRFDRRAVYRIRRNLRAMYGGAWFCRERTLHEEIGQWNKSSDRKTQAGEA